MIEDGTNKWYHLYSNPAIYLSGNQYADGYISDSYEDDMGHSLDKIAEAADEVTDGYRYDTSQVHIGETLLTRQGTTSKCLTVTGRNSKDAKMKMKTKMRRF
jgi:hypothetical protein